MNIINKTPGRSRSLPRDQSGKLYCPHSDCKLNPPTFGRKYEFTRHQNDKHSEGEKYLCHFAGCKRSVKGKGFARKANLAQHMKSQHKIDDAKTAETEEQSEEEENVLDTSLSHPSQQMTSRQRPSHIQPQCSTTRFTEGEDESLQLQNPQLELQPHSLVAINRVPKRKRGSEPVINDAHLPTTKIFDVRGDQASVIQRLKRVIIDKDTEIAKQNAEITKLKDLLMIAWNKTNAGG